MAISNNEYFVDDRNRMAMFAAKNGTHRFGRIYDYYFRNVKDKVENLLEIGVEHGDSIKNWRNYFPNAIIWGLDLNTKRNKIGDLTRIKLIDGNQHDLNILNSIDCKFDFIIDDGSHKADDQLISFNALFPKLLPGGIYFIEDIFTAFSRKDGVATIEFMKQKIDKLQCYGKTESMQWEKTIAKFPELNDGIYAMHVYMGMVAFLKAHV